MFALGAGLGVGACSSPGSSRGPGHWTGRWIRGATVGGGLMAVVVGGAGIVHAFAH
jgi:hypothetical protein